MPGFLIGNATNPQLHKDNKSEYRRKHRWRFTVLEGGDPITAQNWIQLEKAARPSFTLEEPEVHHDQEKAYLAGKQSWETIDLTFYDAVGRNDQPGGADDISHKVYQWVQTVVSIGSAAVEPPLVYKKQIKMQMTDGQGDLSEEWTLYGAWPKNTNWQDLDYNSTDLQRVVVTIRYDRAEKTKPA